MRQVLFSVFSATILSISSNVFADNTAHFVMENLSQSSFHLREEPLNSWYCQTCEKHRVTHPCAYCGSRAPHWKGDYSLA